MAIKSDLKGTVLTLTIDLAEKPYVSNSEKAKAEKEKRDPVASMLATSGGFIRLGSGQRVSFNVLA